MQKLSSFIPTLTIFLLFLVACVVENSFLPLVFIFHWALYRVDLVSITFVFSLGFIYDCMYQPVLGVHSVIYITLLGGLYFLRKYLLTQSFIYIWICFSCGYIIYSLLGSVLSMMGFAFYTYEDYIYSAVIVAAYPIILLPIIILHKKLLKEDSYYA